MNPIPRSFKVRSLNDFVGGAPEELLLCPVRALKIYPRKTDHLQPRPRSLFVSPRSPLRALSKNAISFFLREVISQAQARVLDSGPSVRVWAYSVRGVSTSASFLRNYSVACILEAASWRSPLFTTFYLKDIQFSFPDGFGLGPFAASNSVI